MGDEGSEAVFMYACEHVDRESAVACAYGTDVVAVNIGALLHVVDSCKIVAHVLSGVVA